MTLPQFRRYLAAADRRAARDLKRAIVVQRLAFNGGDELARLLKSLPD